MTEIDEQIIRWTVRASMFFYLTYLLVAVARGDRATHRARWIWTTGLVFFLAHLFASFALYHDWSHLHAFEHTAERTYQAVGWRWGGGVYFNYLFGLIWLTDVVLWWRAGVLWPLKFKRYQVCLHTFFGFMVFNATIVFGPRFWIGIGLLTAALFYVSRRWWKQNADSK